MNTQKGFVHILILALLAVAAAGIGWYVYTSKGETVMSDAKNRTIQSIATPTLSASDEVSDLAKEISTTNVDSVDAGLSGIEEELGNLE